MSEANEMVSKFTASGAEKKKTQYNKIQKGYLARSDPLDILEENCS